MKSRLFVIVLLAALVPSAAIAQTPPDKAMQLLQIVADQQMGGGGNAEVTVGALGTDVPKVPLPDAEIVGTIHGKPVGDVSALVSSNYQIYYLATDEQIKKYGDALVSAGWTQSALLGHGGFVSNGPGNLTVYCHEGSPTIAVTYGGETPRHLQVGITAGSASTALCGSGGMLSMMKALSPSIDAPLPSLHAPQGSQMQAQLSTASLGRTSARITSSSNAQSLLGAFAAQFVNAGWTAGATTTGGDLAMETFSRVNQKHEWECALSIYAVNGKPGEYFAVIQPTDLTAGK